MAYKPGSNRCFYISPDNVIPLTLYHDTPRDDFLLADPMEYFLAILPDAIDRPSVGLPAGGLLGGVEILHGCGTPIFNEDEEGPESDEIIGYLIEDDVQLEIKLNTTCLKFVGGEQIEWVIDTLNIPIGFWEPLPMRDGADYPENKPWTDIPESSLLKEKRSVRNRLTMPLFNPYHKKYINQENPRLVKDNRFIPMEEGDEFGTVRFPDYMRNELTQWYFVNFPQERFEFIALSEDPFKGCEGGTLIRTFEITCKSLNGEEQPPPDVQPIGDPNAPIS